MDASSQFTVPTIIDVPELIVTNDDNDFDDTASLMNNVFLNKLQFLASTLSYTIGLGNLWRFPHLCYKYKGGAFIIAYTLMVILIGVPLMVMELAFGQYANEGPITIWRISPAFEGIGYVMCIVSVIVAIYYNAINTLLFHYLLGSLSFGELTWSKCDNSWNSDKCFLKSDSPTLIRAKNCTTTSTNSTLVSNSTMSRNPLLVPIGNFSNVNATYLFPERCFGSEVIINSSTDVALPAKEYFHNHVLELTQSIADFGGINLDSLLCLLIVTSILFTIMLKGLHFHERLAIPSYIIPYLAIISIFIQVLLQPGSGEGIGYLFTPDWDLMKDIDIWADATTQIFFAHLVCWGGTISLSSMNKFHNNFQADAFILVSVNYLTSLLVALTAFAILGFMSNYSGVVIGEVVDSGIGFFLEVFPEALVKLPLASFNSFIFFAVVLYIGFCSQIIVIEIVITTIVDTWPHKLRYRKPLILIILCAIIFVFNIWMCCFGNGFYLMQLADNFSATYTVMTVGLLELIAIAWVYGVDNFMQDIDDMISSHRYLFPTKGFWYFMWRYLTPSLLWAILLFSYLELPPISYRNYELPSWTQTFGWILTALCLSIIIAMAFIRYLLSPGSSFSDKISYLFRPSEDWAPSSYVSGPKLLNRHMAAERGFLDLGTVYSANCSPSPYDDQDSNNSNDEEDFKLVDGRANYIIPEEEEDTDTGLITNETNV